jgi:hypothetical protein
MGYNTRYELSAIAPGGGTDLKAIKGIVDQHDEQYDGPYALDQDGSPYNDSTWYDYHEDMKRYSRAFPDHIFILKMDGEEPGDHRLSYYKNGRAQEAKITWAFESYDPEKLR